MNIVLASNNKHKLEEIQAALPDGIHLGTLKSKGIIEELPETGITLEKNSLQKAKYVYDQLKEPCIADDTGLLVDYLDGRPGVYSARYAGENPTFAENRTLLLQKLGDSENRKAAFVTIITLILRDGTHYQFKGECKGQITVKEIGEGGFGYDPIFRPDGFDKTFAELSLEQKNKISHRGLAIQ